MAETRIIDVKLKISGTSKESFAKITEGFTSIGDSIKNTITSLDSLKKKLENVTAPASLTNIATSLSAISKVDKSPGLKSIVTQLGKS